MSDKENNRSVKGENIFTKETFGMLIVLFTVILLVCLITRGAVFPFGVAVSNFLYGVFGWLAYIECLALIYVGIKSVTGKGFVIARKIVIGVGLLLVSAVLLLQTVTTWGLFDYGSSTFGQYLAATYEAPTKSLSDVTAGGAVVSFVAYWGLRLFHQAGFIAVTAVGVIASLIYTIKAFIYGESKTSRGKIDVEKSETSSTDKKDENASDPYDVLSDFADVPVGKPAAKNPLNVVNAADFELRGKKDAAPNVKMNNVGGGLNVASFAEKRTVTAADDMKTKIDYIKQPKPINVDETLSRIKSGGSTVTTDYNVSSVIKREDLSSVEDGGNAVYSNYEGVFTVKPEAEHVVSVADNSKREVVDVPEKPVSFTSDYEEPSKTDEPSTTDYVEEYKEDVYKKETVYGLNDSTESRPIFDSDVDEIFKNVDEDPVGGYSASEDVSSAYEPELKPSRIMGFGNNEPSFNENSGLDVKGEETYDDSIEEDTSIKTYVSEPVEPVNEGPEKKVEPINRPYFVPPLSTFVPHEENVHAEPEDHEGRMRKIEETLQSFHYPSKGVDYIQGPSFTRYELTIPSGQSVRTATKFDYDLTATLEVKDGVRIQAPIPGKNLIGVEVANKTKIPVSLKSILEETLDKPVKAGSLMFAIGKDLEGNVIEDDLAKGPHFLVAGSTGSGKSVCLNCLIISLIMRYSPEDLKLVLVDPKLNEFKAYQHLPHLATDEIITEPQKVLTVLDWAYEEMERRNKIFSESGSAIKEIKDYNKLIANDKVARMPRIVIIIDELADLMQQVQRDLEKKIMALAQKSRSAGIHLVLATQRPSVDVITGVIKANLPARIAFKVMTFGDSQTILSEAGAEKLLGRGDMLYKGAEMAAGVRYQGAFVSGSEIDDVVKYIIDNNEAYFNEELAKKLEKSDNDGDDGNADGEAVSNTDAPDPLFVMALQEVIEKNSASISMLQRRFQIGYSKAGGLIDKMEQMGYISQWEGSKARKVLISKERFDELYGD